MGWMGADAMTSSATLTMNSNMVVTAVFEQQHRREEQAREVARQSTIGSSSDIDAGLGVALVLDVLGAAFIAYGIMQHFDADEAHSQYMDKQSGSAADYEKAWKKVEDAKSSRNLFYVMGGISLGLGLGVHIAF
jgi:hypothetical protein